MVARDAGKRVQDVKRKVTPVLARFGVKKASLFGSIVRSDHARTSDVDMLVELPDGASLLDLVRLERVLKETLRKRVDLVTFASLHHLLKESILSEEVPIFP